MQRITAEPPEGFDLGPVGDGLHGRLAPTVRKLADERLRVTLAVSLHTPDDELRDTWCR